MNSNTAPIDIVVAWVDGSDPILFKKRMGYLKGEEKKHPGAAATRFHSLEEVHFCVLSILKFAPFVRKLFIITDQQDPNV
ncbi:Stealth CR1 domain-containing protein, partial [Flavobacteriaceae bacterium]|nr:Stealth CR1 domain-containing protein [Flavobacteriaceae bacterium]